jgi:hypothetical protein
MAEIQTPRQPTKPSGKVLGIRNTASFPTSVPDKATGLTSVVRILLTHDFLLIYFQQRNYKYYLVDVEGKHKPEWVLTAYVIREAPQLHEEFLSNQVSTFFPFFFETTNQNHQASKDQQQTETKVVEQPKKTVVFADQKQEKHQPHTEVKQQPEAKQKKQEQATEKKQEQVHDKKATNGVKTSSLPLLSSVVDENATMLLDLKRANPYTHYQEKLLNMYNADKESGTIFTDGRASFDIRFKEATWRNVQLVLCQDELGPNDKKNRPAGVFYAIKVMVDKEKKTNETLVFDNIKNVNEKFLEHYNLKGGISIEHWKHKKLGTGLDVLSSAAKSGNVGSITDEDKLKFVDNELKKKSKGKTINNNDEDDVNVDEIGSSSSEEDNHDDEDAVCVI